MGFLRDLHNSGRAKSLFSGTEDSTRRWREVFATEKERGFRTSTSTDDYDETRQKPVRGGSWGRSISGAASFKRLLQAMQSMAPGGWSDDRWEQTRHWEGIQYVAGHRKCELLAQSEFKVYFRDDNAKDGKREIKRSDREEYRLVHLLEKPNKEDSWGDLMYRWSQQMDLTGMALTWMVPNAAGTVKELYSIPTAIAIPQPAVNPDFPDGFYRIQPVYPYGPFSSYPTPSSAVGAPIPAEWMMRFKYPHPLLRYDGFSPYTGLRLHIDEVTQMDRSRWYTAKNIFNPNAILSFDEMDGAEPLPEAEIEALRAEFENTHQGTENTGKLYVSPPGSKLEPWANNLKDLEYQQGWEQLVSFVMAGLGITKPAAGMTDSTAYAQLYAALKQLYWLTLDPQTSRISAGLSRRLAPFFGEDLIIEIRCKRIDDQDQTVQKINSLITAKAVTKNEVRRLLDEPETDQPWGKEIAGMDSQQQGQENPMAALMGGGGAAGGPQQAQQPKQAPGVTEGAAAGAGGANGREQAVIPEGQNPAASKEGNLDEELNRILGGPQATEENRTEDEDVARMRNNPGKMGAGSKGPRLKGLDSDDRLTFLRKAYRQSQVMRKVLNGTAKLKDAEETLYNQAMEMMANGDG